MAPAVHVQPDLSVLSSNPLAASHVLHVSVSSHSVSLQVLSHSVPYQRVAQVPVQVDAFAKFDPSLHAHVPLLSQTTLGDAQSTQAVPL